MAGLIGTGIRVAYATGSPHTWKKLEQVLDVTPPTLVSDKIDTSVHGGGRLKRSIGGMQAVTDVVIKMLRNAYASGAPDGNNAPNQNALFDYTGSQISLWFRVEIPSDPNLSTTLFSAYEFQGRVNNFKETAPLMARQEVEVTVVFDDSSLVHYLPYASVIG